MQFYPLMVSVSQEILHLQSQLLIIILVTHDVTAVLIDVGIFEVAMLAVSVFSWGESGCFVVPELFMVNWWLL